MKNEDWLFKLERQIVNNLKQQITDIDVANILEYNKTGEIKDVSYVPVISNSLMYLWNAVEERVKNSFFSYEVNLAEFSYKDIKQLEDLIKYLEEEKNLETDKKKKLFREIEIKKYKQQLNIMRGETVSIKSSSKKPTEITDPIEYDNLEKRLKRDNVSSSEKAQIKRQLKAYDDKMDKLLLETEDSEALEVQKTQDVKQAKEAKKERIEDNKKQYNLEELKAIQKAQATKGKTFSTAFSVSPFMRIRINNLSKILDSNIKETEESKENKIKKYKRIVRFINTEVKEKNYNLKQALEKEINIETNANEDRKKRLKNLLTGNIREKAFIAQIEKLLNQKSFNFEKLESIYRSQLRNPDLTKKQKETISDLLVDLGREDKRNQISTIFSNIKELGSREKKIERIIITEMTAAYNIATFLSSNAKYYKWSIEPEHERRNSVCLVCYERANGGYLNKGVYPKNQIEENSELFIPKHPYCLCRYIPITKESDPTLFAKLEGMSEDEKLAYEQAMDSWVNLSNKWGTLGTVAKGAALTAVSVAALWFAAKRFKKLGDTIEKATGGRIKLKNRDSISEQSPQQIVKAINQEGSILPKRPQYGLGEVENIDSQSVESLIGDTNEGTRLLVEGIEKQGVEEKIPLPELLKTVLVSVGKETLSELSDVELEMVEVQDVIANYTAKTQQAIAPLDLELEGTDFKPEYQNFPLEDLQTELPDGKKIPYELPVLNDLAEQVVKQFTRSHWQEVTDIRWFLRFIEGTNLEEVQEIGEIDEVINQIIFYQKEVRNLLRNLPKEVLSSKNKRDKNRSIIFRLNGDDIGFPFKGKDQEGKAIGFVQEIMKGENSKVIRDNIINSLDDHEKELANILKQAQERRLTLMTRDGVYDLQGDKVFYDPLTQTLKPEMLDVIEKINKDILENSIFKNPETLIKLEEINDLLNIFRNDLKGIDINKLPEEIQKQLRGLEKKILDRKEFIRTNPLLKSSDVLFGDLMDSVLVGENLDVLGRKTGNDKELFLLEYLDNLRFPNDYVKTIEALDLKGASPQQIKETILGIFPRDINIKNKLTFIDKNKNEVLNYLKVEKLDVESKILFLTDLQNSEKIILKDKGNITEKKIREEIVKTLNKLKTRNSLLAKEEEVIREYFELKNVLEQNPTSYMNTQRRLGNLETINKNLEPLSRKFKTTQEKINYLKKQVAVLILDKQKLTDEKLIKDLDKKIEVLTEEIRKIQIAEFRRYEIEKNNNFIQYLSVKDNVLFSKIFREKLKR